MISTLARIFRPRSQAVNPEYPQRWLRYLPSPYLPENVNLTMDQALSLSAVWACIDQITRALVICDYKIYELTKDKRNYLPDDQVAYLLAHPNEDMTAVSFWESILYSALAWGNGYAAIGFDSLNRPKMLQPLSPDRVQLQRDMTTGQLYYLYYPTWGNNSAIRLEQSQVFHLRGPSLGGYLGENVLARAARYLAVSQAQEQFELAYFSNDTIIGTVVEVPGKLQQQEKEDFQAKLEESRQGAVKAHKSLVLTGGAKISHPGTNARDAQVIEAKQYSVEEIARWYSVPLMLLQVKQSAHGYGNNISQLYVMFARNCLSVWAVRLEEQVDVKLLRSPRYESRLDLTPLMQGDFKSRMEGYQIGRNMGLWNLDELRTFEGENAIGGTDGSVRLVPSNMTTMDRIVNPPKPILAPGKAPPGGKTPNPDGSEPPDGSQPPPKKNGKAAPATQNATQDALDEARQLVRSAALSLTASALERFQARVEARTRDLKKRDPNGTTANTISLLGDEANRLLASLREPLDMLQIPHDAAEGTIQRAAQAVLEGEPPKQAASRLIEKLEMVAV